MGNLNHFDTHVRNLATELRDRFREAETVHNVCLAVHISGRPDGDMEISYRLSVNYEDGTKGNHIAPVVNEALRRHTWSNAHAPLCIPYVDREAAE